MTKTEAKGRIEKILEESALGERWSFTDQVLALVEQIEDAQAAAAAERERCAALCEAMADQPGASAEGYEHECAMRIRGENDASSPADPPFGPCLVKLRTDVLEEVLRLLAEARAPRVRYTDSEIAMAQAAIVAARDCAERATAALREALPNYFRSR